MSRPIPPTPDELARRRLAIGLTLLGVLVIGAAVALVGVWADDDAPGVPGPDLERPGAHLSPDSEEARYSAYMAVQGYIKERLRDEPHRELFWRDNIHTVEEGEYTFIGLVDIQRPDGALSPAPYTATVRPKAGGGWELVSLVVAPESGGDEGNNAKID